MVSDWGLPDTTKRRQVISPYRATVLNFGFCFGFSCDIDSYVESNGRRTKLASDKQEKNCWAGEDSDACGKTIIPDTISTKNWSREMRPCANPPRYVDRQTP